MKNLIITWVKRILGLKEFAELDKIKEFLKDIDGNISIENIHNILLQNNDLVRVWVIINNKELFIIKDEGYKNYKVIYRKNKKDIDFTMIKSETPKIYFHGTKTPLLFDKNSTGGTETLEVNLKKYINE